MALFLLPAFYFYLRFRGNSRWYLLAGALGFYFFALLSKETAIALPLFIAYCEIFYFKVKAPLAQRLIQASKAVGFFVVPTAIYFLMRLNVLGLLTLGAQPRYPLVPALLTVPLAIVKYLGLMFIPFGYSYQHYTEFVQTIWSISFLAPLALLLAIAGGVALLKSRLLTFAAVWFIVMLAPALASLRSFEPAHLLQERYLYVPSVGFCLALALGVEWVGTRDWFGSRRRIVAAVLTVILLLVWSAVYIRQNRLWDNTLTVYKNNAAVAPLSPMAHALLSRTYYEAGRPREAEAEARAALDLDPQCATAYLDLSYFTKQSGKVDKACEYLENAIAAVPENAMTRHDLATTYLNLGMLYAQRKMPDRAEQNLLRSIEVSPRAAAWYYTGQFYIEQSRFDDARAMYQRALEAVPGWFAPIHLKFGLVYEGLGDLSRAEGEYNQYLLLAPDAPDRDDVKKHISAMMKRGAPPPKGGP
jgi:tetratricopeptide (TPR) repeat protein